ncbi:MAG: hypothetical protein WD152_02145 [Nitriliruptoraceae bacterium]
MTSASADAEPRHPNIARVIVEVAPFHLDRPFDYTIPAGMHVGVGYRVQVAFSGRRVRGLVVAVGNSTDVPASRLKPVNRVLGDFAWATSEDLKVIEWAARRFGAPRADVVRHALPGRTVDVERRALTSGWFPPGAKSTLNSPDNTHDIVLHARHEATEGWADYGQAGQDLIDAVGSRRASFMWRPLAGETLGSRIVELARIATAAGRGVLVVVPDPSSIVADMIVDAFGDGATDLRGGLSPRMRYQRWLRARCGVVNVVVGERGTVFTPVHNLGLAVVIDEANPAHKELRSPRHNAREVALERARRTGGVGLLTGCVPSAVTWSLLQAKRLTPVVAPRNTERARRPAMSIVDFHDQHRGRLSRQAISAMRQAVGSGTYAVVLAARSGDGRLLVCGACGERTSCRTCGSMTSPTEGGGARCDRCGTTERRAACRACGRERLVPLAAGVRQLAREIAKSVRATVTVMEGYDAPVDPPPAVLVMTRGSVMDHAPGQVGAVVLADLDAMLRRPTLDAAEDTLRLAMTVAQWIDATDVSAIGSTEAVSSAGRTSSRSHERVVVQTVDPDHHVIDALQRWEAGAFWRQEVSLRQPLRLPPTAQAIRIEFRDAPNSVQSSLEAAVVQGDLLMGPMPIDGGEAYLLACDDRHATLRALQDLRCEWSQAGVDVRVDVDPINV